MSIVSIYAGGSGWVSQAYMEALAKVNFTVGKKETDRLRQSFEGQTKVMSQNTLCQYIADQKAFIKKFSPGLFL